MKVYEKLASLVGAVQNCENSNNLEWLERHKTLAEAIVDECLPSGSGFDNGTKLDFCKSTLQKLVFDTAFHHMNESGYYDGWTEHTVYVKANLAWGFDIGVSGKDRNDIKDHIAQSFECALNELVPEERLQKTLTGRVGS